MLASTHFTAGKAATEREWTVTMMVLCGVPTFITKKTLQLPLSDVAEGEKEDEMSRRINQALPTSEYERTAGIRPPYVGPTVGYGGAGFIIGYTAKARWDEENCCCDLKDTRIAFMAIAVVWRDGGGGQRIYFGKDANQQDVVENGPTSTMEHELWHTDGAKVNYAQVEEKLGRHVKRKRGFNYGWSEASAARPRLLPKSEGYGDIG